jgi:hypothetical protein
MVTTKGKKVEVNCQQNKAIFNLNNNNHLKGAAKLAPKKDN